MKLTRIADIRKESGLTQVQLAGRAGMSQTAISHAEKPGVSPRIETLKKIATALDVPVWRPYSQLVTKQKSRTAMRLRLQDFTLMFDSIKSGRALQDFLRQLPAHIRATNDFQRGAYMKPRDIALTMREMAPDPKAWLTALRVDVDRADASTAWLYAEIPQPSLLVVNRSNGHAHYHYLLRTWVNLSSSNQSRFARDIKHGLELELGGDTAYAGTVTHNPLHPDFYTYEGPAEYELGEIAGYLDFLRKRQSPHQSGLMGVSRNKDLFDSVRIFAYQIVRPLRADGRYADFGAAVRRELDLANSGLARPLSESELASIGRSICRWTWARYAKVATIRPPRYRRTRAEYRAQAVARCSEAQRLIAAGLSQKDVAGALGISPRTVRAYLATGNRNLAHEDPRDAKPARVPNERPTCAA